MKVDFLKQGYLTSLDLSSRNYFFLLFFVVSCSLLWAVYIDKHLSADGVNYFCLILDKHAFTYIDWSRQHANYLIEWLVVLGVKTGVRDIHILSWLFGVGIYITFLFSFLLCNIVLPKKDKAMLIFPIASMVAINLSGDYILIGEHQTMVLLSWPILFLVWRNDLSWSNQLLLWGLLIIYSRLYPSAFFTGLIFLGVVLFRIKQGTSKNQMARSIITGILCLAVSGIAFYYIIYPQAAENKTAFISVISRVIFYNRDVLLNEAFLVLFSVSLLMKNRKTVLIAIVPLLVYLFLIFHIRLGVSASQSMDTRTLSMSLLPVMMIFSLFFSSLNIKLSKMASLVFLIYVVIMVTGNIYYSRGWIDLREKYIQITQGNTGFVPIEKTDLAHNPYHWLWNNSQLGIVWSSSCVKSIILNKSNLGWEPFHPREGLILKDYVKYDPFFLTIDRGVTLCKKNIFSACFQ